MSFAAFLFVLSGLAATTSASESPKDEYLCKSSDGSTGYQLSGTKFIAIAISTSSTMWDFALNPESVDRGGTPSCQDLGSAVYIGNNTFYGTLAVISVSNGKENWNYQVSGQVGSIDFHSNPSNSILISVVGPAGGCAGFWLLGTSNGNLKWHRDTNGDMCPNSQASSDGRMVFISDGYAAGPFLTAGTIYGLYAAIPNSQVWTFNDSGNGYDLLVDSLDGTTLVVKGYRCTHDCGDASNGVQGTYSLDSDSGSLSSFNPDLQTLQV